MASFAAASSSCRRLVLHFDVNKTVIVSDAAGGTTTEQMVNSILAEASWGRIPGAAAGTAVADLPADAHERWELDGARSPTDAAAGAAAEADPSLYAYASLFEGGRVEKKVRKGLKTTFTEAGRPGAPFRPHYEQLVASLAIPAACRAAADACGCPNLAQGRVFLLPSFFELVKHLDASGRDFAVVFRTFGTDLPEIAEEFNLFCAGKHPMHPGVRMDGTGGSVDRLLHLPGGTGCFVRDGRTPKDVHLVTVDPGRGLVSAADGAEACKARIMAAVEEGGHRTLGLQDHYDWWHACGESDDSGKIVVVDRSQGAADHHIFFDDNIERTYAHIVDVRDAATGDVVPFAEAWDQFMVRSEPIQAMLEPDYFIRALQRCEAKREEAAAAAAAAAGAAAGAAAAAAAGESAAEEGSKKGE